MRLEVPSEVRGGVAEPPTRCFEVPRAYLEPTWEAQLVWASELEETLVMTHPNMTHGMGWAAAFKVGRLGLTRHPRGDPVLFCPSTFTFIQFFAEATDRALESAR